MEEVLQFIEDCRYVGAYEKLQEVKRIVRHPEFPTEGKRAFDDALQVHQEKLDLMTIRYHEIQDALKEDEDDSEWIFGLEMFGIRTHYQHDSKSNQIKIKLDGLMNDLPLFEQCAVIHEVDLFHEWVPFCRESQTIEKIGKAELFPYINIGIPGLSRDFLMRVYGADCLVERGKLIILGKSIETYPGEKTVPFKACGWFHNRMVVEEFRCIVDVLTPTSAKTTIIAEVNPHAPLPQAMLNFFIKNLAGVLLYFFQKQAMKVSQDPNCAHAHRIRENREFYEDWVLPKLRNFCDFKGWEQPNIISLGEKGLPPPSKTTTSSSLKTDAIEATGVITSDEVIDKVAEERPPVETEQSGSNDILVANSTAEAVMGTST